MKKTLVVVTHPNIEKSVVNKAWIDALSKHPDQYTVHQLYKSYPDGQIDVAQEQLLIEQHQHLIFQFPVYWFNCPPLLKTWFDEVFTYGWAYGQTGDKLKNRKFAVAVTAGGHEQFNYSAQGSYRARLDQVLLPFQLTAQYVKADYRPAFAYYGAEKHLTLENVQSSAQDYIKYLTTI